MPLPPPPSEAEEKWSSDSERSAAEVGSWEVLMRGGWSADMVSVNMECYLLKREGKDYMGYSRGGKNQASDEAVQSESGMRLIDRRPRRYVPPRGPLLTERKLLRDLKRAAAR